MLLFPVSQFNSILHQGNLMIPESEGSESFVECYFELNYGSLNAYKDETKIVIVMTINLF